MASTHVSVNKSRLPAACVAIIASALTAGGIFCFPLYAPALVKHLALTQPEVSTIALAGMSGQYPAAALVGELVDRYGTSSSSFLASILFTTGFGLFAREIGQTDYLEHNSPRSPFHRLIFDFFLCGVGTTSALFSVMFSASQAFPRHTAISTGASTAFFGLSPLFLSFIASSYFSDPDGGLNVTKFLGFLAIFAGITHLVCAIVLRLTFRIDASPKIEDDGSDVASLEAPIPVLHATETSPLLPGKKASDEETVVAEDSQSVGALLRDPNFWLLAMSMLLLLGPCEMVIANIGTIVLGVPNPGSSETSSGPTQVRIISLCNTISRLAVGPLADYFAPGALVDQAGILYYPRKRYASRLVFICMSCALVMVAHLWTAAGVVTQTHLYALSVATGLAYGSTFTVLPSIVASLWRGKSAGRNFGIITYSPFVGTPIFSYIYAFNAAAHQEGDGVCEGTHCWRDTFWITSVGATAALTFSYLLYRRARSSV